MSSSIISCFPSWVVFHQRSSSIKCRLPLYVCNADARANLTTPKWISGVPEPLSEACSSTNQKPWRKDRKYRTTSRNWHVGPVLTSLALDKNKANLWWILDISKRYLRPSGISIYNSLCSFHNVSQKFIAFLALSRPFKSQSLLPHSHVISCLFDMWRILPPLLLCK